MADELLKVFAPNIRSFKLIPSDGGRFEFTVDGELLYSKKELKRHAEPGEIYTILRRNLEKQGYLGAG